MKSANAYAECLAILESNPDPRALLWAIARHTPSAIVRAYKPTKTKDEKVLEECLGIAKTNKVEAVKAYRAHFGTGLKESMEALGMRTPATSSPTLNARCAS